MKTILTVLFLVLFVANSSAAEDKGSPPLCQTVNLYFENDLFGETDQHYTNGIRLSCVSQDLSSYLNDPVLPAWVRQANGHLRFFNSMKDAPHLQRNLVISLGQVIYTPTDKLPRTLQRDDRPFAGWLYLGFAYHTRSERTLDTIELNVGMVGGSASLAEASQDTVHKIRGIEKFNGWDTQLKNELGLQFAYEHKQRFQLSEQWPHQDLILHGGSSLGNVATYVNFGAEYRVGWRLPNDFGTASLRPGGDSSVPGMGDVRYCESWLCGLHGFVSFDSRLVMRDIFLDGNTFTSSHSVDRKPVVADVAVGLSFLVRGWKVSYAKVFRTKEFDEQQDAHKYGSLSISYSW